jgi:hypothetical protein
MFNFKKYKINDEFMNFLINSKNFNDNEIILLSSNVNVAFSKKEFDLITSTLNDKKKIIVYENSNRLTLKRILSSLKHRFITWYPLSSCLVTPVQYFLLYPLVFNLIIRVRFFYFKLNKKMKMQNLPDNHDGFIHNYKQLTSFLGGHRLRTEKTIRLLGSLDAVIPKAPEILIIGPRNDGEVLLFMFYGYKKIKAIDLFSNSPLIDIMDMNRLKYKANSFDIYYSSFVLTYSNNLAKTIAEAIRVTKNNGLLLFSFNGNIDTKVVNNLTPNGSNINNFNQFFILFKKYSVDVIHKLSWVDGGAINFTVILKVIK